MKMNIPKEDRHHGTEFFPVAVYEEHQPPEIMIVDYHWHEECEILWILDGAGTFQIDGSRSVLSAGQLMIVPPCAIHGGIPLAGQGCSFRAVVFHPRILGSAATDLLQAKYIEPFLQGQSHFPYFLAADMPLAGELRRLLEEVFAVCRQGEAFGHELMTKSLLLMVWSKLLCSGMSTTGEILHKGKRRQKLMRDILDYIHAHNHEAIATRDLSDMLGVSESYFCRFFKSAMQMTPTEYIQRCRIKAAAMQLQQSPGAPIIEVAFGCGFNNLSYFNLVFKKLMGCTPTQYKVRRSAEQA